MLWTPSQSTVDRLAGRARLRRVAERVVAADVELLEAEVVRDLLALRVEHVAVAVPDLLVLEALALLDDLLERAQRRREVGDGDDAAAAAVVEGVGHLARRVAAEERRPRRARAARRFSASSIAS